MQPNLQFGCTPTTTDPLLSLIITSSPPTDKHNCPLLPALAVWVAAAPQPSPSSSDASAKPASPSGGQGQVRLSVCFLGPGRLRRSGASGAPPARRRGR